MTYRKPGSGFWAGQGICKSSEKVSGGGHQPGLPAQLGGEPGSGHRGLLSPQGTEPLLPGNRKLRGWQAGTLGLGCDFYYI